MSKKRLMVAAALVGALLVAAIAGCTIFQPTEAVIVLDAATGAVPLTVTFDGTASSGPDGISFYHWAFGTGDESTSVSGTYTYQHAGTYTLTLLVRSRGGETNTATVTIVVEPVVWLTDENLDRVYKLDMDGAVISSFDLPATEPRGVAMVELSGSSRLAIVCANEGFPRIVFLNPSSGETVKEISAPGQSPLQLTFGEDGQTQLWHVDGQTRKVYRIDLPTGVVFDAYGQSYFKATSPIVQHVPFLWTPQGLDWTPDPPSMGHLWYLEGQTHLFYEIEIVAGYDIMSNTQLRVVRNPVELDSAIFPVTAIDISEGSLWAIDVDRHRIVEIDPSTGALTGTEITGFPGSAPSGLEIQH